MLIKPVHYKVVLLLYLASAMGFLAVLTVPRQGVGLATGGSPLFLMCWFIFYSLIALGFIFFKPTLRKLDFVIILPAVYAVISTLWSFNVGKTLPYAGVFLVNTLSVILIRHFFSIKDLLLGVLYAIFILCLISLVLNGLNFELVKYYDPHQRPTILGTDPIRGLFNHKITAGLYSALACFLSMVLLQGLKRYTVFSACLLFNLLTGSSTGLAIILFVFLFYEIFNFFKHYRVSEKLVIIAIVVIIFLALLLFDLFGNTFLTWLGRDPTLTGRTVLWGWGLDAATEKPWFGWSYLGYNDTKFSKIAITQFAQFANYNVPHFHSSYIQTFVDFGFLAGIFIIASYFYAFYKWFSSCYIFTRDKLSLCMAVLVATLLFAGVIIHMFARYNDFPSLFFIIAIAYTGFDPNQTLNDYLDKSNHQ